MRYNTLKNQQRNLIMNTIDTENTTQAATSPSHNPTRTRIGSFLSIVAILFYALDQQTKPQNPVVLNILHALLHVGIIAISFIMVVTIAFIVLNVWLHDDAIFHILHFIQKIAVRMFILTGFYAAALWIIAAFGDSIAQYTSTHPALLPFALSAFILILIARSSQYFYRENIVSARSMAGEAVDIIKTENKLHTATINSTAAHEAGHVLLYAALDTLPENLFAQVRKRSPKDGLLGLVISPIQSWTDYSNELNYWLMLMYLAGPFAEERFTGKSTTGGTNDFEKWEELAFAYLSNQIRGRFFLSTHTELEMEHNITQMDRLRDEQHQWLNAFFTLNAELHRELTDTLIRKNRLRYKDLATLLLRARFPDGFEPFETPAAEG
jgi:hypothetical protein